MMLAAFVVADDKEIKLEGIKCLLKPDSPAKASVSADYKGGKVFFCCAGCCAKFDAEKNAVAANRQLVATKQYKQVKCPLSGSACNAEQKVSIDGVDVCFCCAGCKSKVEKAEGAARAELVFNNKVFEKAYEPAKK
jgi:YHS domain-containing protein